jgi:hypothetical protein
VVLATISNRHGWQQDGIKNGTITVLRDNAGEYDVISKDTMTTFSAKGDGGAGG